MTSLYRVNYHLRAHKRDPLIEFIKSMLLTPFVLHATPATTETGANASDPVDAYGGPQRPLVPTSPNVTDTSTWLSASQASVENPPDSLEGPHSARAALLTGPNTDAARANELRYAEIMGDVEDLIAEHIAMTARGLDKYSRLRRLVPTVGTFFTPLPLRSAFLAANARDAIASRRYVPPSFNELRRILNSAQVTASAPYLRFVTFDGDMTLYPDGMTFVADNPIADQIIALLRHDVAVAVVTAAGYATDTTRYEARLVGLLARFAEADLTPEQLTRFYVLGGECNYLFQGTPAAGLRYIPEDAYRTSLSDWSDTDIQRFLDVAELNLRQCVRDMRLPATVLRKPRAVGLVPSGRLYREQLDECALSTQQCLLQYNKASSPDQGKIPFCAFNGGSDVWVDVGNKLIGVQLLQNHLAYAPRETLHVGDQFLSTGNDLATRTTCSTCWIISPEETEGILGEVLEHLDQRNTNAPVTGPE
ncbi:IMP 5'-nucleotidase [Tieghemiomyces parasiticus]|uniref:IMP-specific 5'-nucleotidase 1 n=1 Tax=Tieghemiomyces parasiticus TaxID=78921 RepID=A0A9W7ZRE3_9FUNG|nr:IMP 5'-nucleotidase [Tieghemiomyces parasiticus]